jgi:hypothetical protein
LVVIIDTSFLLALRNNNDDYHNVAKNVMRNMLQNKFGTIIISDYVFDETLTLAMVRTNQINVIIDIEDYIFKSKLIRFQFIDEKQFNNARKIFSKYFDHRLSFTDCTVLSLFQTFPQPSFVATIEEPLSNLVTLVPGLTLEKKF